MMTKKSIWANIFVKPLAILALCFCAVFAQEGDWAEGFIEQEAVPAVPAAQAAPVVQAVSAEPAAVNPVSADTAELAVSGAGETGIIDAESSMRLGTELSAQALAAAPFVYSDKISRLGDGRVLKPKGRALYRQFDRITVKPTGRAATYRVGDTVDVLNIGKHVSVGGTTGRLITRTGRAVVLGAAGRRVVVQLTESWGAVSGGERITKAAPFSPIYSDALVTPDVRIRGRVAVRVEDTATPYLQQYLIIDKGSADGVMPGDFFRVKEMERSNTLSEDVLEAQVVNVMPNAATLVVLKLHKHYLNVGDEAFLSMRAVNR